MAIDGKIILNKETPETGETRFRHDPLKFFLNLGSESSALFNGDEIKGYQDYIGSKVKQVVTARSFIRNTLMKSGGLFLQVLVFAMRCQSLPEIPKKKIWKRLSIFCGNRVSILSIK